MQTRSFVHPDMPSTIWIRVDDIGLKSLIKDLKFAVNQETRLKVRGSMCQLNDLLQFDSVILHNFYKINNLGPGV